MDDEGKPDDPSASGNEPSSNTEEDLGEPHEYELNVQMRSKDGFELAIAPANTHRLHASLWVGWMSREEPERTHCVRAQTPDRRRPKSRSQTGGSAENNSDEDEDAENNISSTKRAENVRHKQEDDRWETHVGFPLGTVVLGGKLLVFVYARFENGDSSDASVLTVCLREIGKIPWIRDYPELGLSRRTAFDEIVPLEPLIQPDRLCLDAFSIEEGSLHEGLSLCRHSGVVTGVPLVGGQKSAVIRGTNRRFERSGAVSRIRLTFDVVLGKETQLAIWKNCCELLERRGREECVRVGGNNNSCQRGNNNSSSSATNDFRVVAQRAKEVTSAFGSALAEVTKVLHHKLLGTPTRQEVDSWTHKLVQFCERRCTAVKRELCRLELPATAEKLPRPVPKCLRDKLEFPVLTVPGKTSCASGNEEEEGEEDLQKQLSAGTWGASIQRAVDVCPAGGTVRVLPGCYAENVVIAKRVTLEGADDVPGRVIIAGSVVVQKGGEEAVFS